MGDVRSIHSVELAPTAPSLYVQNGLLVQSLLVFLGHIAQLKLSLILNYTDRFVNCSFLKFSVKVWGIGGGGDWGEITEN